MSPTSFPTPINLRFLAFMTPCMPCMYNSQCYNIICRLHQMVVPIDNATNVCVEWLCGQDCANCVFLAKTKLKSHVRQSMSITCPKICLQVASKMLGMVVALMWKPMAHSFTFTFSSSILDELESHIIPRLPFQNAWKQGKFNKIGKVICGSLTLLTTCGL